MKVGLSTYSLSRAIQANEMTVEQVIEWVSKNGGDHVEIVPIGFEIEENPDLIDRIREKADALNLELSNYAIGANFVQETEKEYEQEIERVIKHVDIANQLGVKLMRHDAASRPVPETSITQFEEDLPKIVAACRRIADYASPFGITTNIENHGLYLQASDRVQRVVAEVNRPNFKTIMDIGNFLCVDEDPVSAVKNNLPYTSMVHLKDFYYRTGGRNPGPGWLESANGNFLRGAIVGHGDLSVEEILQIIYQSGYDGYLSIEFEGLEDCRLGSKLGMDSVRTMIDRL